jgi:mycothiol system anti-sigma-R factor
MGTFEHPDPHDIDCADVVEAVYLYLDGELDHEAIAGIKRHLDECAPCLREYGIEQEVKALVVRSCCEEAPESLRASIVQRIQVVRSEVTITELRTD